LINRLLTNHGPSKAKTLKHIQKCGRKSAKTGHLKGLLKEVSKKLKAIDGVDIEALRARLDTLKKDRPPKKRNFRAIMPTGIFRHCSRLGSRRQKGKNSQSDHGAADHDAIKASKNQAEDMAAALKALAESDALRFGEPERPHTATPAKVKTVGT
jgi:hypothetical protein